MKLATMLEINKCDQMIKQLSNDLKKEREECKRKDSALRKVQGFLSRGQGSQRQEGVPMTASA
jgi:hypothetical protein